MISILSMGYDLFEDVIDTSFYHTDNLQKKFNIVKENFKIIENDLTLDGRFREDIWKDLKKINLYFLMDGVNIFGRGIMNCD